MTLREDKKGAHLRKVGLSGRGKGDVRGLHRIESGVVGAALDDTAAIDAP